MDNTNHQQEAYAIVVGDGRIILPTISAQAKEAREYWLDTFEQKITERSGIKNKKGQWRYCKRVQDVRCKKIRIEVVK